MLLANPIYDVVFKYMMEDEKVARAFLSAIIGEMVLSLELSSTEHTLRIPPGNGDKRNKTTTEEPTVSYTVCRFDFAARISVPGGHKMVYIELQKAKFANDIVRFRRYLGSHYQRSENAYVYDENGNPAVRQIYCVFLLGHDISVPDRPVIAVNNDVRDATTNENIEVSNDFILGLHHRSWIVQIKQLKKRRRSDLEKLLEIFDQKNCMRNPHLMNLNDKEFPASYRHVIRRLNMATQRENVQTEMEMEDEYMEELKARERREALKDKALEEKDKAIAEHKKVLAEKNKELDEKDKELEAKDKYIKEIERRFAEIQRMKSK